MTPRQLAEEMQKVVAAFELADGPVVASLDADILSSIRAIPATLIAQAGLLSNYRYRSHGTCIIDGTIDRRCLDCRAYDAMMEDGK